MSAVIRTVPKEIRHYLKLPHNIPQHKAYAECDNQTNNCVVPRLPGLYSLDKSLHTWYLTHSSGEL